MQKKSHMFLLLAASICTTTIYFAIAQAGPILFKNVGIGRGMETLPLGVFMFSSAIVSWYAKHIINYIGEHKFFLYCTFLAGIGALVGYFSSDHQLPWAVIASVGVMGAGLSPMQLYQFAGVKLVEKHNRSKVLAVFSYSTLAGALMAPMVSGISSLILVDRWPTLFFIFLIFISVGCLLIVALLGRLHILESKAAGKIHSKDVSGETLDRDRISLKYAILLGMLANVTMSLLMASSPLYMQICGLSVFQISRVFQTHFLAMFAPSLLTGFLLDKFGYSKIALTGSFLIAGAGMVSMGATENFSFALALILSGLGWNFVSMSCQYILANYISDNGRIRLASRYQACSILSSGIAAIISSPTMNIFGWKVVGSGIIVLASFCGLFSILSKRGLLKSEAVPNTQAIS